MNILKEIPPTAGFPIYAKELASCLTQIRRQGTLEEDFKNYLGVPYAQVTCSGTAAFYLILEGLKGLSTKKTIIIPSFICPLVPLAINRAGFKVSICDIEKDNFNFDIQRLKELCLRSGDILAIVVVHLAGIPAALEEIKELAFINKILIIEDCAQSLGAVYKDKFTGTLGEFSFFSLCRGKGLTIYEGGLIVTQSERYSAKIDSAIERLAEDDYLAEGLKILELLGYWIFYRPSLFWFVFRLPQIFWNWRGQPLRALTEYFTIDFPVHKVSRARKVIGHVIFSRLQQEIGLQRQKAAYYIEGLKNTRGIKLIKEAPGSKATYPYFTLIFDDAQKCRKAKEIFKNSGLGVSQIYTSAITDYGYLGNIIDNNEDFPNARYLSEREITLSTSKFLKKRDQDSIIETIKGLL